MNASEVIEIAKEWVDTTASQMPGFIGAHLMGGINYTPKDAPFASFKDVDMNLLFESAPGWEVTDISYRGIILEYGSVDASLYQSAEAVLANPDITSNLAVNSILSDPTGFLAPLQVEVAREYPQRKWVNARCEHEKKWILASLEGMSKAKSPEEALFHAAGLSNNLAGLIAVASLKPPTHRRGLVVMKGLLDRWGRPDLHEDVLQIPGYGNLSRPQVEFYHHACALAFDKAVEVTRTPVPFGFKLHNFVKPYFVEGIQEMIDEGCHREAMYWTSAGLWIAGNAIQADATEEEKKRFQELYARFLSDIGLLTMEEISARQQKAIVVTEEIFQVAKEMVSRNPGIMD